MIINEVISSKEYISFVKNIKDRILLVQYNALKKVNKELIDLYWNIGKDIVTKQEEFGWGKSIVKNLSIELQKEFVGMRGFSERNLWNMRNFYIEYKDNLEREFYIKATKKFGWTYRVLSNQIDNRSYEKYLLNQTLLNNKVKLDDKNPSIGIIICQEKNRTTVEYALKANTQPMGVATYQLSDSLHNNLKEFLPSTEEIENNLLEFLIKDKNAK